jgi:hypothetical protein
MSDYASFLREKVNFDRSFGFDVDDADINPILLPHQRAIVKWALTGGRRAIFAAFGLGKSVMQLEILHLVLARVGGKALIVCPLGVRQEFVRDAAMETGFLRCPEPGKVEFLLSHNIGFSEIWYGAAEGGKVEMHTAGVSFTETAKEVTAGSRMYGNVEGDLLYAYDMAAVGQELQPHTWARLQRA